MEQGKKERYNLQSLLPLNVSYDYEYRLSEADVRNVNSWIDEFEKERLKKGPKPGDMVLYTSRHGDCLSNCLIERYDDYGLRIVTKPSIPFLSKTGFGVECIPDYGPVVHLPATKLQYAGKTLSLFKIRGVQGAQRNGYIHFYVEVDLWEYKDPDPLYGEFTTKDWRKIYLRKVKAKDCLYSGNGIAFSDEDSFQRFLKVYQGTSFPGNYPDQIVVWCYKDILKKVPAAEWERISASVTNRKIGSEVTSVKIVRDTINHQIVTIVPIQEKN